MDRITAPAARAIPVARSAARNRVPAEGIVWKARWGRGYWGSFMLHFAGGFSVDLRASHSHARFEIVARLHIQ